MSGNFVVWALDNIPNMVSLSDLENFDDTDMLRYGESVAAGWPDDVTYRFDPERKKAVVLTDTLFNTDGVVVASEKLVALLKKHDLPGLEYLPLTVLDHKKKQVKPSYTVVHPVNPISCLDKKASKAKMSKLVKTEADEIKTLIIDESKVPPERKLFRVAEFPSALMTHRSLAEAIDKAGIVGIYWIEPSKFPE